MKTIARMSLASHALPMRCCSILALIAALYAAGPVHAQLPQARVGDEHIVTRSYRTSQKGSDESSSSSSGQYVIAERIVRIGDDGVELEYDLPRDTSAEDRAREWQVPARVLRSSGGALQLLNRADLEARLDGWLRAANWTREVCGRWIFTWNAFRIECDPDTVLVRIRAFDLRAGDLRDGAVYRDEVAQGPGVLTRRIDAAGRATFVTTLALDPEAIRRARAESDVALGEIMGSPLTLEAALRRHAAERITGTIEVTFDLDPSGQAWRRTDVTQFVIESDGRTETNSQTIMIERHPGTDTPRPATHEWRMPG